MTIATTSTTSPTSRQRHAELDFCLDLARAPALLAGRLDERLGTLHGISFSDFQLLSHLNRAPGARLRRAELAGRVALSASSVTRALLPLEKIGLVAREPDPRDTRLSYATLTAAGRALLPTAAETAQMVCARTLKAAPEQFAPLATLLAALLPQMEPA